MFGRCENADVSFSVGDFGNLALAIIQLDLNTRSSSDLRGQRVRHVGDVPIDHQVRNFHVRLSLLLERFSFDIVFALPPVFRLAVIALGSFRVSSLEF